MRILLIRHGPPDFVPPVPVRRDGASAALAAYWDSAVTGRLPASLVETLLRMYRPDLTVTSDLPRARDSARLLGLSPVESDALWAEADLPHTDDLPVAMPWAVLLALGRIAWRFGYARNADGRRADRERARAAADRLVVLAGDAGTVALVAHGVINRMIRAELVRRGWCVESRSGDGPWSCTVLEK